MNASEERTRSLWMEEGFPQALALEESASTDVLVVGAGIAGLSAGYELARAGRKVMVVDRGAIGGGMTARTTAHLTFEIDDFNYALIARRGEEVARAYFDSQRAAVDRIEAIANAESIACDFARIDGFYVPAGKHGAEIIAKEYDAARHVGFKDLETTSAPAGHDGPALRFPQQARFHPLKYLHGLVAALRRMHVELYANTAIAKLEEINGRVRAETANGHVIDAKYGVSATNAPFGVAIHTKQAPYRTYAIAAPAPKGSVADVLVWDTLDPYHYVRLQPGDVEDMLIIGGEDHKSGTEADGEERIARLRNWAIEHYPMMGEIAYSWSGQVYEPIDFVPHDGRNPGDENIYVITGDSGQGITNGVAGALLIADLIEKSASAWEECYNPSRKTLTAAGAFIAENASAIANTSEHLVRADFADVSEIGHGQGGLVQVDGHKAAVYRDETGELHALSAACTHVGCVVHFNPFERCWDCPCHGSQFGVDGEVLAGPARKPLEPLPREFEITPDQADTRLPRSDIHSGHGS
jgi:glycine/D-amino acid oxidase-like deaminating enzyme/nitrite reductase/ring-hydroxylating ferredoxin subunit